MTVEQFKARFKRAPYDVDPTPPPPETLPAPPDEDGPAPMPIDPSFFDMPELRV